MKAWCRVLLGLPLALFVSGLAGQESRLVNVSTLTQVGTGADVLTVGFYLSGNAPQDVLIRAVGPALAAPPFNVAGTLANPELIVFGPNSSATVAALNDDWIAAHAATFAAVGAFALPASSRDAAVVATLPPGAYTAQVRGVGNTTGNALVEVYGIGASGGRFTNLSTRAQVTGTSRVLTPGFVITPGAGTRKLLLRAAGPALTALGVAEALGNPALTLVNTATLATIATNDDWGTPAAPGAASAAALAAAFSQAGAFAFPPGSRDSALLVDLPAGNYTLQLSGVAGSAGLALAEVYDLTPSDPASGAVTPRYSAPPAEWLSRGVGGGGGMFAPSFSPHDTSTAFLAVDMSHVLRTTDGFASWTTIAFDQLQGKQFTEVQFTATPSVLYAAEQRRTAAETTLARPVKSTDQGATWMPFGNWAPSLRGISVHASPLRSDTFLTCTGSALYFYRNAGRDGTFVAAHSFNGAQGRVAGVFWQTAAAEECWVGTNEGMLYSTNGGQSFRAAVAPPTVAAMASFAGGRDAATGQIRFYAITTNAPVGAQSTPQTFANGNNQVWRLDWGAANWIEVTGALTGSEHATIIAMARDNADVVYAATNRPANFPDSCAVWRLNSPGGTWQNIFTTAGNANIATGWLGYTQRGGPVGRLFESDLAYAAPCGLAVHPTQPQRVLFSDNAQITLSTNASSTTPQWRAVYTTLDNPGHGPGQLIPNGQSYLSNGLEVSVCTQLEFCGPDVILAAMLDLQLIVSKDAGRRWGWPYDHTTLGGGDVNSVAYDPVSGTSYAAAAFTNSAYEFLGADDAHTDNSGPAGKAPPGVYYQVPGESIWRALKTDFGVAAGQRGANPVWLTFDRTTRRLYVSVVSSSSDRDGIYVCEVATNTWRKLPAPVRDGRLVQHPFTVCVLPDGGLVASYCAHQVGDANVSPATTTNGAYRPTSGVYYLPPDGLTWVDRTRPEMRYFTRDVIVDPHDASGRTWFACVWNTDSNVVTPPAAGDLPAGWGGLYRTTDAGGQWTRIWSGDATFSGSATSCTLHPHAALKDELLLTTRFSGLWISQNVRAAAPTFSRVESYRFRAPERVYYDPANQDRIWVTSAGNGIVEGTRR